MCRFKSGIILKNRIVIAEGENDSHSDLLESLGIEDDYIGATRTFVRAELVPKNDEWWVSPEEHPEKWNFVVDQDKDFVPGWFDRERHEKEFRESVCAWWEKHVLADQKIKKLDSGYYRIKGCDIQELAGNAEIFLHSSTVQGMYGSSTVQEMCDGSTVQEMWDSSVAIDFKNYPKIKIIVQDPNRFKLVKIGTETEDSNDTERKK